MEFAWVDSVNVPSVLRTSLSLVTSSRGVIPGTVNGSGAPLAVTRFQVLRIPSCAGAVARSEPHPTSRTDATVNTAATNVRRGGGMANGKGGLAKQTPRGAGPPGPWGGVA